MKKAADRRRLFSLKYWFYDFVKITAIPGLLFYRPHIEYESPAAKRIRGGALVIGNHLGFFDPVYLMIGIWYRRHHFICLQEILDNTSAWMFEHFLCIPIDRNNFGVKTFKVIVEHLKNDEIVSMFPEGHINNSGDIAPFKSGAVLMAYQSQKPIVPVYVLEKRHWYERLRIMVGTPIRLGEEKADFSRLEDYTRQLEEAENRLKMTMEEKYHG